MKRLIVFVLMIIAFGTMAHAMEEIKDPKQIEALTQVVRAANFACGSCGLAYYVGVKHRGKEFKVYCYPGSNKFRVTLTPDKKFIVEPW